MATGRDGPAGGAGARFHGQAPPPSGRVISPGFGAGGAGLVAGSAAGPPARMRLPSPSSVTSGPVGPAAGGGGGGSEPHPMASRDTRIRPADRRQVNIGQLRGRVGTARIVHAGRKSNARLPTRLAADPSGPPALAPVGPTLNGAFSTPREPGIIAPCRRT